MFALTESDCMGHALPHLVATFPQAPTLAALAKSLRPWFSPVDIASSPIESVPGDVLLEIASHLSSQSDVLHFAQTCTSICSHILPLIYTSVSLPTARACLQTLDVLASRPELSRHVRILVVDPDASRSRLSHPYSSANGLAVASAICKAAPRLDALHTFVWDGEELPPDDDTWLALRMSCPQLRYIGCSMGSFLPVQSSQLYNFRDLLGFSVNFKERFYRDHGGDPWPEEKPEFPRLWQMLHTRCPALECLAFEGVSTAPADMRALCEGRWPRLHTLILGDVTVQHPSAPDSPFVAFLDAHPNLEVLHITSRTGVAGADLAALEPAALPRLREFGGSLDQVAKLPQAKSVEKLRLSEPLFLREATPLGVAGVLRAMEALRELAVTLVLHSSYDHGGMLRCIVSSCPQLVHLDFTCAAKPCFLLDTFARAIKPLSKLRSLNLGMVKVPGEEPLVDGAVRLARANPRLQAFTVTHIPRGASIPLRCPPPSPLAPFPAARPVSPPAPDSNSNTDSAAPVPSAPAIAEHQRATFTAFEARATGAYTLACDAHGLPVRLDACERHGRWRLPRVLRPLLPALDLTHPLGLPLRLPAPAARLARWARTCVWAGMPGGGAGGGAFADTRATRYTTDLRPVGHPAARRKPWVDVLFRDRSAAGEEARLLVFCLVLVGVAAWGFVGMRRCA